MKNIKSKHLFIISVVVTSIVFVVCMGAIIYLFTDRSQPEPKPMQPNPTQSPTLNAAVTQSPDETAPVFNQDEDKPNEPEPLQVQPTQTPVPDSLPESGTDAFPSPTEAPVEQPEATPAPAAVSSLELISREEAGLDTVPKLNFDGFALNQRIRELLQGMPYTAEDMINGIEQPYLITERFQGAIIENITIGTSLEEVVRILGAPSFQERNMTVYKTKTFYIGFYGAETVELASFIPAPKPYSEDMLNTILTALCMDEIYLTDWLEISETASGFFQDRGFIHGGGHYAISSNGIRVDTLSQVIEIYNNFEGFLYKINTETELKPVYTNTDIHFESLYMDFLSYTSIGDTFAKNGKVSPSGKYIAIYEWITSDSHHYTIRTADHSVPDYTIGAVVRDFDWLNDDYIVYTAMFTTLPAVLRVADGAESYENILLMEEIDELDYFYGYSDHDFTIDRITEDTITLKDNNAGETGGKVLWEFSYSIDEGGNFIHVKEGNQENDGQTVQE